MGEYDALPGLSQKLSTVKEPVVVGGCGHGFGHNLLGTGSIGATLGIKKALENGELKGTIRYYGCPAEETFSGKVFMIREGVFDDLDAALVWHPEYRNFLRKTPGLAMNSVIFKFKGISAHAAAPHLGRSALDGVELMNIGVNYLREHVEDTLRIHYIITTNGGGEPNVVPDEAEAWYYSRVPERRQVKETLKRIIKIAEGAAMMTDTALEVEFVSGSYSILENSVLEKVVFQSLMEVPIEEYTEEELEFAKVLNDKNQEQAQANRKKYHLPADTIINRGVMPEPNMVGFGSTDVGDVVYIVPGISFRTKCANIGAVGHSWQFTACSGHSIGHKGV